MVDLVPKAFPIFKPFRKAEYRTKTDFFRAKINLQILLKTAPGALFNNSRLFVNEKNKNYFCNQFQAIIITL